MKKVLLTLLFVIVALGALAGAGIAGYQVGYQQGVISSDSAFVPSAPFRRATPYLMPMHRFGVDTCLGFNCFQRPMMAGRNGFGINFFSPFRFLWNLAVLALVIWFVYWLFTKSGWRITRDTNKEQENPSIKTEG